MRVIIILLAAVAATAWAGYAVRHKDRIASAILFVFSALTAIVLVGAFFGFIGPDS